MEKSQKSSARKNKLHRFKALGNLDGESDVPEDELEALSNYIHQRDWRFLMLLLVCLLARILFFKGECSSWVCFPCFLTFVLRQFVVCLFEVALVALAVTFASNSFLLLLLGGQSKSLLFGWFCRARVLAFFAFYLFF